MSAQAHLDGVPERLWEMVRLAAHRLLMLDYDGTLAPFTVSRAEARAVPGTIELLDRIAAGADTSVAIVSGRPVHEVERLAGPARARIVGEHGWECRAPDGSMVFRPLGRPVEDALQRAEDLARGEGLGALLERKRSAVVLHTRGLEAGAAGAATERCERLWRRASGGAAVVLDHIDGGLELRARGRDKGTAVLSLLSQSPAGTLGVFVGDDVTDEDAFEVVREWGFGVKVGPPGAPTLAMARLPGTDALPGFLERWLGVTAGARTHGPSR